MCKAVHKLLLKQKKDDRIVENTVRLFFRLFSALWLFLPQTTNSTINR